MSVLALWLWVALGLAVFWLLAVVVVVRLLGTLA